MVNLNSRLRPKLSRLVSVFGLSWRLIQKVKWPNKYVIFLVTWSWRRRGKGRLVLVVTVCNSVTMLVIWRIKLLTNKAFIYICNLIVLLATSYDKKLSCRREAAQWFVSLNISLSHSRSLKVIRNVRMGRTFLFCLIYGVNTETKILYLTNLN